MNNIDNELQNLKIKGLSLEEKSAVWKRILAKREEREKEKIGSSYVFLSVIFFNKRMIGALMAIIVLLGGSFGTAAYADSAVPGDTLFPIDVASEKIRLAFTFGERRDSLRVRFSEERLSETKEVFSKTALLIKGVEDNEKETTSLSVKTTGTTSSEAFQIASENVTVIANAADVREEAFETAVSHLEENRKKLLEKGNTAAVLAIDSVLSELAALGDEYLKELDEVKVNLAQNNINGNFKIAIETKSDDFKTKFKIEEKEGKKTIILEKKERNTGRSDRDDNDGDEDEDDDRDNDDHKITVCHNRKETISISRKALSAHIRHGDRIGSCRDGNGTTTQDTTAPELKNIRVSDISQSKAEVNWDTNERTIGKVWYATSSGFTITKDTKRRSDNDFDTDHEIDLSGLSASTTYYFVITATDKAGNTATSTEKSFRTKTSPVAQDTTKPVLTDISAGDITTQGAKIHWHTNEGATGRVWFGTTSPLLITHSTNSVFHSSFITDHTLPLSSLIPETIYRYIIVSKDAAGNTATSSEHSFTTVSLPDTQAPALSGISAGNISSSSAQIIWNTSEPANGRVWFSTSSPLLLGNASRVSHISLITNHALTLSPLAASTTYHYIVVSQDASGNTATSTEKSLATH